jgi:hypothetical protein
MKLDLGKILFMFLSLLFALYCIISCSAEHHLAKMAKHREKALNKGATIKDNVDTVWNSDTLITTITKNDTVWITKTVTNTVTVTSEPIYVTKFDRKREYRLHELLVKETEKTERLQSRLHKRLSQTEIKQEAKITKAVSRHENRTKWWVWLLIGIGIGVVLKYLFTLVRAFTALP